MIGAREYATLFGIGNHQRGRLMIRIGRHARGYTCNVFILQSADPVIGFHPGMKSAVEVYGIVNGQPGWTEEYGWLHKGKWVDDVVELAEARREELWAQEGRRRRESEAADEAERLRVSGLLASY